MFQFEWPENLSIFLDNLCIYHVCFDLFSFFMIIFTWWYCNSVNTSTQNQEIAELNQEESVQTVAGGNAEIENPRAEEIQMGNDVSDWCEDLIISNVKFMKQKALMKELKSKLTEDELEDEKKTEKMQLEKIFQLLQEQEDKFQMSSMEQLEDQLHLYIN